MAATLLPSLVLLALQWPPPSTAEICPTPPCNFGPSPGVIVGIFFGCFALVVLLIVGLFCWAHHKNMKLLQMYGPGFFRNPRTMVIQNSVSPPQQPPQAYLPQQPFQPPSYPAQQQPSHTYTMQQPPPHPSNAHPSGSHDAGGKMELPEDKY